MLLYAIIFVSGGAILALELLASRIMTPYFGVSLYIWTGILSITLISLALGYHAGGKLAARQLASKAGAARLIELYVLMPALAALAIVGACLVYPHAFATLANWSLIPGAFAACLVLLFLPLVATSAMNPLLVAVSLRTQRSSAAGDAGAGKVFFVSTLGSVAGVFVTAFGLIPYISNFTAVLVVAVVLALLTLSFALSAAHGRKALSSALAALALVLAGVLMWNADNYTKRQGPFAYGGATWRVEATESSLFGTVKVLRSADLEPGRYLRMYFQDGLTQNTVDSNNRSASFYTYALEGLARGYRPDIHGALVLGLGAGMVPMRLAEAGAPVEVVDIDPVARRVAEKYFGFSHRKATTHQADARTFLRRCSGAYDVVVVDLFHGDGTPDYLVTREFFRDLRACLAEGGVAVFNTFADLDRPASYAHFLVTLKSELPHLALYRPAAVGASHVNSFVVASAQPLPPLAKITFDDAPEKLQLTLWNMLSAPVPLTPALFAGGRVVTDAVNAAAHDFAQMQVGYRRSVVQGIPAGMLMN
jgi:spermidine synthase/TM2 domain-containing membrane protein YozV